MSFTKLFTLIVSRSTVDITLDKLSTNINKQGHTYLWNDIQ